MAIGEQKLKLLYVFETLHEMTDEEHPLNATQLLELLEEKGFKGERKTIYNDMDTLKAFGVDIVKANGKNSGYYVGERYFELEELKLLIDALQSFQFVTEKKTKRLINKLKRFASRYESTKLERRVLIREKENEHAQEICDKIDLISSAMTKNTSLTFKYPDKEKLKTSKVSPWEFLWGENHYYLIGFAEEKGEITYFQVDRIEEIEVSQAKRLGEEAFKEFNLSVFLRNHFSLYKGLEEWVTLRCKKEQISVIMDHFGRNITIYPETGTPFYKVDVLVSVSPQFFGWLTGLGKEIRIENPKNIQKEYVDYLKEIIYNC